MPNVVHINYNKGYYLAEEPSLAPEGSLPSSDNVIMQLGEITHLFGLNYYLSNSVKPATTPAKTILHVAMYVQNGKQLYYVAFTDDTMYEIEDAAFTSLHALTNGATTEITTTSWLDKLYIGGVSHDICYWSGTDIVFPAGWTDIKAKCVLSHYSHLVVGYTVEGPTSIVNRQRVRWSKVGDPDDTTSATSGFVDIIDTPGEVTGLINHGDRLYVLKFDSIWELVYVGGTDTFKPVLRFTNVGCIATQSILNVNGVIYFLSDSNICAFDGDNISYISENISELIVGQTKQASSWNFKYARACYYAPLHQLWFTLPEIADYADLLLVYDLRTQTWWSKTFPSAITSMLSNCGVHSLSFKDLTGTFNDYAAIAFEDISGESTYFDTLLATKDGLYTARFNTSIHFNVAQSGYWESQDYTAEWEARWFEINAEILNGSIECSYSTNSGKAWVSLGTKTANVYYTRARWEMNITAKTVRLKFTMTGDQPKMKNINAYVVNRKGTWL